MLRVKSAYPSEVGEEFSSCNILEHEVQEFRVLAVSVHADLDIRYLCTIRGCEIELRILFSEITWSTCLILIISAFLRALTATKRPVFLCLARRTLPKDPALVWRATCAEGVELVVIVEVDLLRGHKL